MKQSSSWCSSLVLEYQMPIGWEAELNILNGANELATKLFPSAGKAHKTLHNRERFEIPLRLGLAEFIQANPYVADTEGELSLLGKAVVPALTLPTKPPPGIMAESPGLRTGMQQLGLLPLPPMNADEAVMLHFFGTASDEDVLRLQDRDSKALAASVTARHVVRYDSCAVSAAARSTTIVDADAFQMPSYYSCSVRSYFAHG